MEYGNMTRDGGKLINGVLCTTRAQAHWEMLGHCEEQISEFSHLKQGSWVSIQLPSVISWKLFPGTFIPQY